MGIINPHFTMPGKDMPPQEFRNLRTQQGQINWLAQFLMSVNTVFDTVIGDVTTIATDAQPYVNIVFDPEGETAEFHFFIPQGAQGEPGHLEAVTATTQTLAPGSSATVTATFDSTAQTLDFSFGLPDGTVQDGAITYPKFSNDVLAAISNVVSGFTALEPYLYKENAYIDAQGNEGSLAGYNLYKVPFDDASIIDVSSLSNAVFWGSLNITSAFTLLLDDDSYLNPTPGIGQNNFFVPTTNNIYRASGHALFVKSAGYKAVMIGATSDMANTVIVKRNVPHPIVNDGYDGNARKLETTNTISTPYYIDALNKFNTFQYANTYRSFALKLSEGDKVTMSGSISGLSFLGSFRDNDGARTNIAIGSTVFTAPTEGIVFLFYNSTETLEYTYLPKKSIMLEAKNIIGLDTDDSQFIGLDGVAFGTSLTYRSQTTGGYLSTLEMLSGISFDNQGIGSSFILGNMLTAIKGYTGYTGKRICTLEGFVNDWYNNNPLGTWKDANETTVCGCVRSALNYILSQNDDLTVFLILDHYGRLYSGVDCSTTAKNASDLTQFEYYSEIAKVAKSLGIPVIAEYEISGISENTPQYLLDNIHCNSLGANQSACAIWYQMKQHPVNLM